MTVEVLKADPDSQYRLVPCRCGGEPEYHHIIHDVQQRDSWIVYCPECGAHTFASNVRHHAQIAWNILGEGVK